ncbi:hypothetical protein F5887DRAFT_1197645 [Amanita rubescens]|nr:hypothetical protein F5887DRAFT_1197645 [Amanita rubescens]
MTTLPSLDTCGLQGTGLSIWRFLLQAEITAHATPRTNARYNDPLVGIRLLGFFLKDFWDHAHDWYLGSTPYSRMVLEIASCLDKGDDKAIYDTLVQLGLRYRNYLLRVFRSNTRGRPTPSRHESRPSFEVVKGRVLEELDKAPQTKSNVRKQALLRDGYKCAISGVYDRQSCLDIEEVNAARMALDNPKFIGTEVAHIFSESAQDGDKNYAAAVFEILELFGLGKKAEALYGGKVNGLHNVIIMATDLHDAFESFDLWLEPVRGQENTYNVCGKQLSGYLVPIPSYVTFKVEPSAAAAAEAMNKRLMLPDQDLIAIRAACARVANLSGAAEQANQIIRDMEDTTVLTDDGSMAEIFSLRLSMLISRQHS